MNHFKAVTHVLAVAFAAVVAFAVSPAGQAIVSQYPKLSGLVALLGALGALYHEPRSAGN